MNTVITPFPLGVYVGDPNVDSASGESEFETDVSNFTSTIGSAPTYYNTYIDYTQPVSDWASDAGFEAASGAQSAAAKTMVPVIGLPLASINSSAGSLDSQYQAVAAGNYDSVYQSIVQSFVGNGDTNLIFRPGWEMNISGSTYAGDTPQDQADWVAAYQHVYTVIHQEAATLGVNVTVVWNPGVTNYTNAEALTNLYPGSNYVDAIGADMYSDMYPYADGTNSSGQTIYRDWDTGGEDTSVAQFEADPVNREHYWLYPAATTYSSDGSGGHSLSLDQLITFAEQQGKPFAIPETGAGSSGGGQDVSDDAAFPQWLAGQLTTAEAQGENIDFVNIWDSNAGGNYEFSYPSDGKPNEAAAWAQYFGPGTTSGASTTTTGTATITASTTTPVAVGGSGPDTLALNVVEDAYLGDAQFTVSVDGKQVGGTQTATALRSAGSTQEFDVLGDFAPGSAHTVTVNFLNDAYGGSASLDRNLYITQAALDGTTIAGSGLTEDSNGPQSFSFQTSNTLILAVSEDAYQGDAQYKVLVDGNYVGDTYTATASHAAAVINTQTITGNWGEGAHTVGIQFINDAYGGAPSLDRNLYINSVIFDGTQVTTGTVKQAANGVDNVAVPATNALTLNLSEDAYQGDAQFTVSVDGKTVDEPTSVTALHSTGASQAFNFGSMAAGTHDIAVSFLNDAYGGSPLLDRNLYVAGAQLNGVALSSTTWTAAIDTTSTQHFSLVVPA